MRKLMALVLAGALLAFPAQAASVAPATSAATTAAIAAGVAASVAANNAAQQAAANAAAETARANAPSGIFDPKVLDDELFILEVSFYANAYGGGPMVREYNTEKPINEFVASRLPDGAAVVGLYWDFHRGTLLVFYQRK
jgi:hypothetical protein